MTGSVELTINWDRAVYVTGRIGDELVTTLTPQVLKLRQQSSAPITIAIDSFGGTVSKIDVLLGLVTGPNQDGTTVRSVTVVTHEALSAAASLLAFGDYAVALPHSSILFHDVRYGGVEDVTPDKALTVARQLEYVNDSFALRLATVVFRRLTWLYIDVAKHFGRIRAAPIYPEFKTVFEQCGVSPTKDVDFELAALAATIYTHVSPASQILLQSALARLKRWGTSMQTAKLIPMFTTTGGQIGLLDGVATLYKALDAGAAEPLGSAQRSEDFRLFLMSSMIHLANSKEAETVDLLEEALSDFKLMDSINDPSHLSTAARLMLRHRATFFTQDAQKILASQDEAARAAVMAQVQPYVKVMWHMCVLLCRALIRGDHPLTPRDALMFGLVDEVPGDDVVESRRRFRTKREEAFNREVRPARRLRAGRVHKQR